MVLTDKCLAMATAIVLVYGTIFAGNPSLDSNDHIHSFQKPQQALENPPQEGGLLPERQLG